jgi:hypothetical protein
LNNSGCRRRGSQEKEKHETNHDKRRYNPTLTTPQPAMMAVMGMALWLCNIPNTVEVMAAMVNCILPKRADAAPALVLKGAIASAVEFGRIKPMQEI